MFSNSIFFAGEILQLDFFWLRNFAGLKNFDFAI